MPAPELHGPCTFDGIAAEVHVRGEGAAVLLEPAVFAGGKVDLTGAQVGGSPRSLHFDHPEHLEPLEMNRHAEPYDVTYQAGQSGQRLVVEIRVGGQNGKFKGALYGAPECAARWCTVTW